MQSLKRSSFTCFVTSTIFFGCSTLSYRILHQDKGSAELSVNPERILLECEWIRDADDQDSYGFMIHVLDEENTVLTISQGNILGKDDCERRIKKIGRIMREGRQIYIAGLGSISEPRVRGLSYTFPQIGTFSDNGRTLQFIAIANEHGLCYDAYSGDAEKPCPPEPFPKTSK